MYVMHTDYTHPLASLAPLSSHQPAFLNAPPVFMLYVLSCKYLCDLVSLLDWKCKHKEAMCARFIFVVLHNTWQNTRKLICALQASAESENRA